jgi:hypothetical protein
MIRRVNLSAALIVLVCFFLPWVQVSCGGASDSLSGFDLARDGHTLLWLVPLLMLAVLTIGLLRSWKEPPAVAAIVSMICGAVAVLLMNRERLRVNDEAALISAQLTGWFWLSMISALAVVGTAIALLLRRRQN